MMVLALIWIILIITTGVLASRKGRSVIGWLLLSILVAPLTALILIALPANEENIEARKIDTGKMVKCPFCAELIRPEAIVCRYCGRDTEDEAELMNRYGIEHESETGRYFYGSQSFSDLDSALAYIFRCPRCGTEVDHESEIDEDGCPNCVGTGKVWIALSHIFQTWWAWPWWEKILSIIAALMILGTLSPQEDGDNSSGDTATRSQDQAQRQLGNIKVTGRDVCENGFDQVLAYPGTANYNEHSADVTERNGEYIVTYSGQVTSQNELGNDKTVPYECMVKTEGDMVNLVMINLNGNITSF